MSPCLSCEATVTQSSRYTQNTSYYQCTNQNNHFNNSTVSKNDKIRSDHMPSRSQIVQGELHCSSPLVNHGGACPHLPLAMAYIKILFVGLSTSSMLLMLHCKGNTPTLIPPIYIHIYKYIYN